MIVRTTEGTQKFGSTLAKPYHASSVESSQEEAHRSSIANHSSTRLFLSKSSGFTAHVSNQVNGEDRFQKARISKFNDLMGHGVFTLILTSDARKIRLYSSRFVDSMKHEGKPEALESHVLWFRSSATPITAISPTLQLSNESHSVYCWQSVQWMAGFRFSKKTNQKAYVQSETSMQRPIFMPAPKTLQAPLSNLLGFDRLLYGLSEAELC